jgi:hypothetical protein
MITPLYLFILFNFFWKFHKKEKKFKKLYIINIQKKKEEEK